MLEGSEVSSKLPRYHGAQRMPEQEEIAFEMRERRRARLAGKARALRPETTVLASQGGTRLGARDSFSCSFGR
jgi:hypothetical protein